MALVKTNWLDGATSLQTTAPEEVVGTTRYGLQMSTTGSPTSATVVLQGSIDGVNWFTLASTIWNSSIKENWSTPSQGAVVKFIRLQVTSLSGGTAPTVSASVIAV